MPEIVTFADAIQAIEDRGWTLTYDPKAGELYVYTAPGTGRVMVGGSIGSGKGGNREEAFRHTVVSAVKSIFWRRSQGGLGGLEASLEEERRQGRVESGEAEEVPGGVMHGMRIEEVGEDSDENNSAESTPRTEVKP